MNNINSFTFFKNYYEAVEELNDEDKYVVIIAILDYIFKDIDPEFTGIKKVVWLLIKPSLSLSKKNSRNAQKPNKSENKTKSKRNEIKSKSNQNQRHSISSSTSKEDITIYDYLEFNFNRTISPIEYEQLNTWLDIFTEDIIRYAIELSCLNNSKNLKYVFGILKNWKSKGVKTIKDILIEEDKRADNPVDLFDYDWLSESEEK